MGIPGTVMARRVPSLRDSGILARSRTMVRLLAERYVLGEEIGRGGMAVVHRARDQRLGRDVAIKLLRAYPPPSAEMLRLFRREAQATSRLTHPNIVNLFDFGELPDGQLYLAMELLTGRSLGRVLADLAAAGQTMPWRRAADIGLQLCAALAAAHERKILHRDLTPANCFRIDAPGMRRDHIKLLDFGIAHIREGTQTATFADPAKNEPIMGTPHYIAPEVIREERGDHRIDIYSVGVLLYEMTTGMRPYTASSLYVLLHAIAEGQFTPPRVRNPDADLTDATEQLILRAMHPDPAQRFANAGALADALEATLGGPAPSGKFQSAPAQAVLEPIALPLSAMQVEPLEPLALPPPVEPLALPPPDRSGARKPLWLAAALLLTGAVMLALTRPWLGVHDTPMTPTLVTPPKVDPVPPPSVEPPDRRALEQQRRAEFEQGLDYTKQLRDRCILKSREYLTAYEFPVRIRIEADGGATVEPLASSGDDPSSLPDSARACMLEVLRGIRFAVAEHDVDIQIDARLR